MNNCYAPGCEAPPLPTYSVLQKEIHLLAEKFPIFSVFSVGRSVLLRDIPAVSVGTGNEVVFMAAATHGQEWLTSCLLMRFLWELGQTTTRGEECCNIDFRPVLKRKRLVVVPCLNPDGVEIALSGAQSARWRKNFVEKVQAEKPGIWQANARGVDLNHNFDAGFPALQKLEQEAGITSPSPTRYGGKRAFSEPETRAVAKLIRKLQPKRLYSFHSQGEEIFWEYQNVLVPESGEILRVLTSLSGYTPIKNAGLASHGGMKDWFIQEFHKPGFTIEIGKGENPLPLSDLDPIYRRLRKAIAAMAVL